MASISDRTHDRQGGGAARDPGAPLTARTMALFAGMVLTGAVTLGLVSSAIASLLVPENQIGLRPYLVSWMPAVLMLFLAIIPALWCYWFWHQIFPPAQRPKRRAMPRRRSKGADAAATRAIVPKTGPRPVPRPPDPSVTERATADLLKRREERREQAERRRLEERRLEEERRREEHQRRLDERRRAEEERVRAAEARRRAEEERRRTIEERRVERRRLGEERRRLEEERRRAGEPPVAPRPPQSVAAAPAKVTPLAKLRLSKRVHTTLSQAGIETVEQLTSRTQAEVLELKGIGAKSLEDVLAALDRDGRALRYPQRFSRVS
ncbi:MAG TPA: DNA-directed RNA polymerase subunit alpha C-terminal domain-containing protein [Solirubrobacteraceae bacterium]|nr:DNA-directed RNA polymerase subunit alpha C-terminal domain-containing protein [Solirubrobacteraceae bacterium]